MNDDHEENGMEIITISKRIADVIFGWKESAFVGQESELDSAEPEALSVIMEHHHHFYPRSLIAQKLQNMQSPSTQLKMGLC